MSFTNKILIAMAAGIAVGVLLNLLGGGAGAVDEILVDGVLRIVGTVFIAGLQMMVVPLVLVSLVCGVASLGDVRALGRVGGKTIGLYLLLTPIAVLWALLVGSILSPGEGFELTGEVAYQSGQAPSFVELLINIVPRNPIRAMADGDMLQIIFFALLLGYSLTLAGEHGRRVASFLSDLNEVILEMIMLVIKVAPIGVFALLARTFATEGFGVFLPLVGYFFAIVLALLLHLFVTYATLVRMAGLNAWTFFSKLRTVMTFAFSTSSSSATIPVTLSALETRMGVRNSIAAFTVPLGATVNMDGTAIMQSVAVIFIANVYGVDLALADYLTVILIATLAAIGTAPVPSAGLIMLAMVLAQVGLPVEGIGLIIGVDRLLDMLRTVVNVMGDAVVTCVVAKTEGAMDLEVFNDPRGLADASLESASMGGQP